MVKGVLNMKLRKTIGVGLSCVLVLSSLNVSFAATMENLADTNVDETVSA